MANPHFHPNKGVPNGLHKASLLSPHELPHVDQFQTTSDQLEVTLSHDGHQHLEI